MDFRSHNVVALVASLVLTAAAPAQFGDEPITFEASVLHPDPFSEANRANAPAETKFEVKRGEVFVLRLTAKMADGWYTYPLTRRAPDQQGKLGVLSIDGGEAFQPLYPVQETGLVWKDDKELGAVYLYHPKPFTWSQEVYVKPTAPVGKTVLLTAKINVQVCKDQCVDREQVVTVPITIAAGNAVALTPSLEKRLAEKPPGPIEEPVPPEFSKAKPQNQPKPAVSSTNTAKSNVPEGLWGTVVAAMIGGLVSLLTPCVFPMIPITVSYFIKQSEAKPSSALVMAAVYSATIVFVLTLGGMALLPLLVRVSQHYLTNFALASIFVFFALSLFGMYEITLPSWLQDATAVREGKGGLLGVFFMALTFSIISFACVGPIYGGFITLEASGQADSAATARWVLGPLTFSTAFAAPFFLLALFPSLLRSMPRAGSWMNSVKVVMGFLEIAAAVKFLRAGEIALTHTSEFLTFDLGLGLYVAISLACALYLFGFYRLPHDHDAPETIGVPRLLFSLAFLTLGIYLTPGLFKKEDGESQQPRGEVFAWVESFLLPDFVPSSGGKSKSNPSEGLHWHSKLPEALAEAKKENKLLFIDFTGEQCTNCRKNERNIFPRPEVRAALSRHVLLTLYTDGVPVGVDQMPPAAEALKLRDETSKKKALPTYMIVRPKVDSFEVVRVDEQGLIRDVPAFVKFLTD